jgi:serine protease SohB
MAWLSHYAYFLVCALTVVIAILASLAGVIALLKKPEASKDTIQIKHINTLLEARKMQLQEAILSKDAFSAWQKEQKKLQKSLKNSKKNETEEKPRLFVLPYSDDIRAKNVSNLSKIIDAILLIAHKDDSVLISITTGGGVVNGYGLGASELMRLKQAGIRLIASVDKVAASGGYMMAAVADEIIAAPFAMVGSIGVIAQVPNFYRLLEKHGIHFEQVTAGAYKRTLTAFGENTDADRQKVQEEVNETQALFKAHVAYVRPQVDIDKVATGEVWFGKQAIQLGLVDRLQTFADYVLNMRDSHEIFELTMNKKTGWFQKLSTKIQSFWAINFAQSLETMH